MPCTHYYVKDRAGMSVKDFMLVWTVLLSAVMALIFIVSPA